MAVLLQSNAKAFHQFLEFCRRCTDNDGEVIKLLEKRHKKTCQTYLSSAEFGKLILSTTDKIRTDLNHKFVYIKEFITELKAYGPKVSKRHVEEDDSSAAKKAKTDGNDHDETTDGGNYETKKIGSDSRSGSPVDSGIHDADYVSRDPSGDKNKSDQESKPDVSPAAAVFAGCLGLTPKKEEVKRRLSLKKSNTTGFSDAFSTKTLPKSKDRVKTLKSEVTKKLLDSTPESSDVEKEKGSNRASERQIKKLEMLLGTYDKKIKELEEEELNINELGEGDSDYILLDKLKAKFVKIWALLCEAKGRDTSTGRPMERRFKYEGTRYPEINRKIEKFINKHRIFPDYHDVRQILSYCNKKHHLHLGKKMLEGLSKDVFSDVGNKLQERRQEDLVADFGCHLTDKYKAYDDPAMYDRDLRRKLEENKCVSKNRLEEVINKFAEKQMRAGDSDTESESEEEEDHTDKDSNKAATPVRETNPEDYDSTPELQLDDEDDDDENDRPPPPPETDDKPAEDDVPELCDTGKKRRNNFRRIFSENLDSPYASDGPQTSNMGSPSSQSNIIKLDTSDSSDSEYCTLKVGNKGLEIVKEDPAGSKQTHSPKPIPDTAQEKDLDMEIVDEPAPDTIRDKDTDMEMDSQRDKDTDMEMDTQRDKDTYVETDTPDIVIVDDTVSDSLGQSKDKLGSGDKSNQDVKSDLADVDLEIVLVKESDSETPSQHRHQSDNTERSRKDVKKDSVEEIKRNVNSRESVDTDLEIVFVKETKCVPKDKRKVKRTEKESTVDLEDNDLEIIDAKDVEDKPDKKGKKHPKRKFSIVLKIKSSVDLQRDDKVTVKSLKNVDNKEVYVDISDHESKSSCSTTVQNYKPKLKGRIDSVVESKLGHKTVNKSNLDMKTELPTKPKLEHQTQLRHKLESVVSHLVDLKSADSVNKAVQMEKPMLITEISSDDTDVTSSDSSSDSELVLHSNTEQDKYGGKSKKRKRKHSQNIAIYGLDDSSANSSGDNCSVTSLPSPKRLKISCSDSQTRHTSLPPTPPRQSPKELTSRARSSPELRLSQGSQRSTGSLQLEICNIRSLYDLDKIWSADKVCSDYIEASKYVSPEKVVSSSSSKSSTGSLKIKDTTSCVNTEGTSNETECSRESKTLTPVNSEVNHERQCNLKASDDKQTTSMSSDSSTVPDVTPLSSQETGEYLSLNECSHPNSMAEEDSEPLTTHTTTRGLGTVSSVDSTDVLIDLDAESSQESTQSNVSKPTSTVNMTAMEVVTDSPTTVTSCIPLTLVDSTKAHSPNKDDSSSDTSRVASPVEEGTLGQDLSNPPEIDMGQSVKAVPDTQSGSVAHNEEVEDFSDHAVEDPADRSPERTDRNEHKEQTPQVTTECDQPDGEAHGAVSLEIKAEPVRHQSKDGTSQNQSKDGPILAQSKDKLSPDQSKSESTMDQSKDSSSLDQSKDGQVQVHMTNEPHPDHIKDEPDSDVNELDSKDSAENTPPVSNVKRDKETLSPQVDNEPEMSCDMKTMSPKLPQPKVTSARSFVKTKLFSPSKLRLSMASMKKASVALKASLFKLGHDSKVGAPVPSVDVEVSSISSTGEDVELMAGVEPMEYDEVQSPDSDLVEPHSNEHQLVEPTSAVEPTASVEPSSSLEPSASVESFSALEPFSVLEPNSAKEQTSDVGPISTTESSSVVEHKSLVEATSPVETSSVVGPSSVTEHRDVVDSCSSDSNTRQDTTSTKDTNAELEMPPTLIEPSVSNSVPVSVESDGDVMDISTMECTTDELGECVEELVSDSSKKCMKESSSVGSSVVAADGNDKHLSSEHLARSDTPPSPSSSSTAGTTPVSHIESVTSSNDKDVSDYIHSKEHQPTVVSTSSHSVHSCTNQDPSSHHSSSHHSSSHHSSSKHSSSKHSRSPVKVCTVDLIRLSSSGSPRKNHDSSKSSIVEKTHSSKKHDSSVSSVQDQIHSASSHSKSSRDEDFSSLSVPTMPTGQVGTPLTVSSKSVVSACNSSSSTKPMNDETEIGSSGDPEEPRNSSPVRTSTDSVESLHRPSSVDSDEAHQQNQSEKNLDKHFHNGGSPPSADVTSRASKPTEKDVNEMEHSSAAELKKSLDNESGKATNQASTVKPHIGDGAQGVHLASPQSNAAPLSSSPKQSSSKSSPKPTESANLAHEIIILDDSETLPSVQKDMKSQHTSNKLPKIKTTDTDRSPSRPESSTQRKDVVPSPSLMKHVGSIEHPTKKSVNQPSTSAVTRKEGVPADLEDITIIDDEGESQTGKVKVPPKQITTKDKTPKKSVQPGDGEDSDDSILITQVVAGKKKKKYVIRAERPQIQPVKVKENRLSTMQGQQMSKLQQVSAQQMSGKKRQTGSLPGGLDLTSICKSVVNKVVKEGNAKGNTPPPNVTPPIVIMPNGAKISGATSQQQRQMYQFNQNNAVSGRSRQMTQANRHVTTVQRMSNTPRMASAQGNAPRYGAVSSRGNNTAVKFTGPRVPNAANVQRAQAVRITNNRPGVVAVRQNTQNAQYSTRMATAIRQNMPIVGVQRSPRKIFVPRTGFTSTPIRAPKPVQGHVQNRPRMKSLTPGSPGVRTQTPHVTGVYKVVRPPVPSLLSTIRNDMTQFKMNRQGANMRMPTPRASSQAQYRQVGPTFSATRASYSSKIVPQVQPSRSPSVTTTAPVARRRRRAQKSGEVIVLSDSD